MTLKKQAIINIRKRYGHMTFSRPYIPSDPEIDREIKCIKTEKKVKHIFNLLNQLKGFDLTDVDSILNSVKFKFRREFKIK